jgi:DNA-directed RNA polymerase specialized sigma24 family protein
MISTSRITPGIRQKATAAMLTFFQDARLIPTPSLKPEPTPDEIEWGDFGTPCRGVTLGRLFVLHAAKTRQIIKSAVDRTFPRLSSDMREDLVQEVWIRLVQKFATFGTDKIKKNLPGLIYFSARNTALQILRSAHNTSHTSSLDDDHASTNHDDPGLLMEHLDLAKKLSLVFAENLALRECKFVRLAIDDVSISTIAEILDVSQALAYEIRKHIRAVLLRVIRQLENDDPKGPDGGKKRAPTSDKKLASARSNLVKALIAVLRTRAFIAVEPGKHSTIIFEIRGISGLFHAPSMPEIRPSAFTLSVRGLRKACTLIGEVGTGKTSLVHRRISLGADGCKTIRRTILTSPPEGSESPAHDLLVAMRERFLSFRAFREEHSQSQRTELAGGKVDIRTDGVYVTTRTPAMTPRTAAAEPSLLAAIERRLLSFRAFRENTRKAGGAIPELKRNFAQQTRDGLLSVLGKHRLDLGRACFISFRKRTDDEGGNYQRCLRRAMMAILAPPNSATLISPITATARSAFIIMPTFLERRDSGVEVNLMKGESKLNQKFDPGISSTLAGSESANLIDSLSVLEKFQLNMSDRLLN